MPEPLRLTPLREQFEFALDRLVTRVQGMTDPEYLWEPVANCWSVRRRQEAQTTRAFGAGDWVLEFDRAEPGAEPFTTIAWRVCNLYSGLLMRADYTNGAKSLTWDEITMPHTATAAVDAIVLSGASWRSTMDELHDADLDEIGRSSFPWGLDPQLPYISIVWWVNQELLHHGAEIALLRDLYRERGESPGFMSSG